MIRRQLLNGLLGHQGSPNVQFHVTCIVKPNGSELHVRQLSPDYRYVVDNRNISTHGRHGVRVSMSQHGLLIESAGRIKARVTTCTSARRNKVKIDIAERKGGDVSVTVMIPTNTSAMFEKTETTTSHKVVGTPQPVDHDIEELMGSMFGLHPMFTRHPSASPEEDSSEADRRSDQSETSAASNGHAHANGSATNGVHSQRPSKKKARGKKPKASSKRARKMARRRKRQKAAGASA